MGIELVEKMLGDRQLWPFIPSSNLITTPAPASEIRRNIDLSLNVLDGGSLVETTTLKMVKISHNLDTDASIASTPGRSKDTTRQLTRTTLSESYASSYTRCRISGRG